MTAEAGDRGAPNLLVGFTVMGRARPKGSLKAIPFRKAGGKIGVHMKEQSTDGSLWRQHVATVARVAVRALGGYAEGGVTGFPTVLPVRVVMRFGFERIKGTTVEGAEHAPVSGYFGDVDKLVRNVLDALTDAGVYADDRLVTRVEAVKCYVADGETAHTTVEVWEDW